uniref:Uncharacterized protein n=1 Tax=Kalanchoe fedtschenkoi TaxID=63787 RepID=A0A7N0T2G3_KALFE
MSGVGGTEPFFPVDLELRDSVECVSENDHPR